jgi:MFS family permease
VGKVMGYNTAMQSIGSMFGPFIVGFLYSYNHHLPFFVAALIATVLYGISLIFLKK